MRKFFETILAGIIYSLIFAFIRWISGGQLWPAFILTVLIILVLHDQISAFIRKLISYRYYTKVKDAALLLDQLNTSLNNAVRYHDVTRQLFNSFDSLLSETPYAFFIMENNKYYLAHYADVRDEELTLLNFNNDAIVKGALENELMINAEKCLQDKAIVKIFNRHNLDIVYPFLGHTQPIAFLVVNSKYFNLIHDAEVRRLFEKIQKKAGLILENTALLLDLERKNTEMRKLIEMSQKILSSFDIKNILDFVIATLQTIIGYDAAAIFLLDKSGKKLLNTSSTGYETDQIDQLKLKVGQGAVGWVAQTGKIDLLEDVRNAEHYWPLRPQTRSQISLPLLFDGRVLGVLCLESNRLSYFNSGMVDSLKLFTHLAAIALHNAQQLDLILANKGFEHDLINASTVQKGLLVQNIPVVKPLKVSAVNISSKIISGDLYDVIKYNDSALGLAIGDVSGKGAPAALMMTLILAGLRSHKQTFLTVCDLVYRLNNLLCESTIEGKYASFFYGVASIKDKRFYYCNAGHNPPIFIRADGSIQRLTEGGPVIGFLSDHDYIQNDVYFDTGDLLVAYTDGITEAMNSNEEEFGEERLTKIAVDNRNGTVQEIKETILQAVREFSSSEEPLDDMTLLICKFA
ncbi:MAG: SpoIIE family protein phosphatase [Calditrichaceae bacterium]|nr:SpoIIE family protein phosphatase [Calditrichaceae bacterium]RQV92295.1 MAG: GAF domain-containing protein [Calditrichota bacterium]